jgi:hypothetical protein
VLQRVFQVLLDEICVDRDRRGRTGTGRRDHSSSWVDDVAGWPHAGIAGAPGGGDGDETDGARRSVASPSTASELVLPEITTRNPHMM